MFLGIGLGERAVSGNKASIFRNIIAFLALVFVVLPAYAQDESADGATLLEEIVVTARKRAENLQSTPVSVVALSAEKIERLNISSLDDMSIKLPNVSIGSSGGMGGSNGDFGIRGLAEGRNAVTLERPVAVYIDDAYYGRSDGALLSVLDIERIEVLRGPQGTLFGRNTTGGAVRYITAKPSDQLEGKIQVTGGSFSRTDAKGMINLPLGDRASARLTAAILKRDGFAEDTTGGGRDTGDIDSQVLRAQIRWDITPDFEALLSVDYTGTDTNGTPSIVKEVIPGAALVGLEAGAGFDATTTPLNRFEETQQTAPNFVDSESTGVALDLTWDLGHITLRNVASYRDVDARIALDVDGTIASLFEQNARRGIEMINEEFQIFGEGAFDGRLDWVLGFFYYDEETTDHRDVSFARNALGGRFDTRIVDPVTTTSRAVFGSATIKVTPRVFITAGLRFTDDEKTIFVDELRGGVTRFGSATNEATFSRLTGDFTAAWQVTDDVYLYGKWSRGFRAGGINDRPTNPGLPNLGVLPFDEEVLDVLETGLRSEWLDNRLRFNLTAFFGEFDDMQVSAIVPGSVPVVALTQNAGEASLDGIEGELEFVLNDHVSVDASFASLDAEYTRLDPGVTAVTLDSDFPRAPDFSYAVGLEFNGSLGSAGMVTARLDWGWKDSYRLLTADNVSVDNTQESYGLLGARIDFEPGNAPNWRFSVFGTNLTDEEYATGGVSFKTFPQGHIQVEPGRPQEFGATVEYRF